MIYLFFGENDFEKRQRLVQLEAQLGGNLRRVDGENLTMASLSELIFGQSLFGDSQPAIIHSLSESIVWANLPELIGDREAEAVLVENKVDKRTKTYKWLQKNAKSEEFTNWGERDVATAVDWCVSRAEHYGFELPKRLAAALVERLGVEQLRLDAVIEQLSLAEKVDQQLVDALVPLPKIESVFGLLEAAMESRIGDIKQKIAYLEMTEGSDGAYRTVGLLTSQLLVLAALVLGGDRSSVAKDFGANPYVVGKLSSYANRLSSGELSRVVELLFEADTNMKTSNVSEWLILETALVEIAAELAK